MVGFGPQEQILGSLLRYKESHGWKQRNGCEIDQVFVNGHFPLDYERNQLGLKQMVTRCGFRFLDPGKDIGSAQSQQWALEQVGANDEDYWVNLDPDSACDQYGWLEALFTTIERCPDIGILSLNSQWHWERAHRLGVLDLETRYIGDYRVEIPNQPDMFNLSIWRMKALNAISGIQQGTPYWGNVESYTRHALALMGYRTAILYDFMEATDLKLMQPMVFIDWKVRHGIKQDFPGSFKEYCERLGLK